MQQMRSSPSKNSQLFCLNTPFLYLFPHNKTANENLYAIITLINTKYLWVQQVSFLGQNKFA